MSDTGSDLAPLKRQAKEFDQTIDGRMPDKGLQESPATQDERRNPAWLVLEILFITILVFFWL